MLTEIKVFAYIQWKFKKGGGGVQRAGLGSAFDVKLLSAFVLHWIFDCCMRIRVMSIGHIKSYVWLRKNSSISSDSVLQIYLLIVKLALNLKFIHRLYISQIAVIDLLINSTPNHRHDVVHKT